MITLFMYVWMCTSDIVFFMDFLAFSSGSKVFLIIVFM